MVSPFPEFGIGVYSMSVLQKMFYTVRDILWELQRRNTYESINY